MKKCDHTIGFLRGYGEDDGDMLVRLSSFERDPVIFHPDEEFKFCPECGSKLPDLPQYGRLTAQEYDAALANLFNLIRQI